jgi:hypothetical protein
LSGFHTHQKENTMISKNPAEPQGPQAPGAKTGAAETSVPPLDPHSPIETAATGSGTVNDPSAKDTKPPGFGDADSLLDLG